jgi:hypothetical protein
LIRRDPWFGDDGKVQTFHGMRVVGKDTDKYGFKIVEDEVKK